MFQMEIDSSPGTDAPSHYEIMIQRLTQVGIPDDYLNEGQNGVVAFAKNNRCLIVELVNAILLVDEEYNLQDIHRESMIWLQWLMFEGDPKDALDHLAKTSTNQRGVCGAVWGRGDIAYRCETCQQDPTCAICVPCFENGDHKDHDYAVTYTTGGCCDCGDTTAWKHEGFCSKHKGVEQIQPLPERFAKTLGPVLDVLLKFWRGRLVSAEKILIEGPEAVDQDDSKPQNTAQDLTCAVVEMLLEFCQHSESLLSFIGLSIEHSFLNVLLRTERVMDDIVVRKLHDLLLKLLVEPVFKIEFGKAFMEYYPENIDEAISECSDSPLKTYPLLSTFAVQIFTVPTLTLLLVEQMGLMNMLLECLEDIFVSCAGEDGRLQVTKWTNLYETTLRVVRDIKFVMSHCAVPKYMLHKNQDLVRRWIGLLVYVHGMQAQKRETGSHIEDEDDNAHFPFVLCHSLSDILTLLVAGAFSISSSEDINEEASVNTGGLEWEDQDKLRLSQESSIRSTTGKGISCGGAKAADKFLIPLSASLLIYQCLRSIENWSGLDNPVALKISHDSVYKFSCLRRTRSQFGIGRGRYVTSSTSSNSKPTISNESNSELEGLRVLSSSDWLNIMYDVSSLDISLHIPLHRLLLMVIRKALKECYGESGCTNQLFSRPDDFICKILEGTHPYGFSAFVMEHPLRIRVFCAQVKAGMWRRNGDVPILFREWYRSVSWSEQGVELDLFLLQCCAALAPPDLYVQRILERFGLSDYLSLNHEQSNEYENILVAEMLMLLIQIVKERRFSGLTTAECLQRELVHSLCIGDATRSQLVKSLPCDVSKVDELQKILDTVAEYSQPSGTTQGLYKLRSSYWKECDLYHPRLNSRDRQSAEERYSRFCNVSASIHQLPRWTKIYSPLMGIAKIATCKTLLQICRAVLFYAIFTGKLNKSRASDDVLLIALHLLALTLDVSRVHKESIDPLCYKGDVISVVAFAVEEICVSQYGDQSLLSLLVLLLRMHEKKNAEHFVEAGSFCLSSLILSLIKTLVELDLRCMTKLVKLAPHLASQFSHSILDANVKDGESISDNEKHKAKSRERQAAILEKMRAQQSKFLESCNSDEDMDDVKSEQEVCDSEFLNDSEDSAQVICSLCHDSKSKSPVSYLVLLQKSGLLSFVDRGPPSWEQVSRSGKEHVFNSNTASNDVPSSSTLDDSEMVSSSQLVDLVQSAVNDFASVGQPSEVNAFMNFIETRFSAVSNIQLPCTSKNTRETTAPSFETLEEHIYLLIRGSQSNLDHVESTAGVRTNSAESLLLGKYISALPKDPADNSSASENGQSDESITHRPAYDKFGPCGGDGIYISSCGHAVHQGCLDRYLSSQRGRHTRRVVLEGMFVVDPQQGEEFLCPVCRGLANSIMPALCGDRRKVTQQPAGVCHPLISDIVGSVRLHDGLTLIQRAANVASSNEILKAFPAGNVRMNSNLEPILRLLCGMYCPGRDKILETGRVSQSLILWDTLKYSLLSTEFATRSNKSSLIPNYSLAALYKELNSSSGFILSLLLDAIRNTQTMNSLTVLLRLRGIQLFASCICSGSSPSDLSNYSFQQGGNMIYILENAEPEMQYPDIQLWRRASEPVLARDAFSSLMWILFCLPWPILSCKESFMSLVHVFYLVTVTQAIITYREKMLTVVTETGFQDSLVTDIYRVMGKCGETIRFFDYDFIDPTYDIKDSVRSLTFPYLRRCALLWRLLINCSMLSMQSTDNLESTLTKNTVEEELLEVEKLEKMFNIPPISIVVNDVESRVSALRWTGHFLEIHKARRSERVSRCTRAIPFKLMPVPHLYQDILQRCIRKLCPDCGIVIEEPALCLLCGKLCSANWKNCCREMGCQTHVMACGAGTGVFLLVRSTKILLQRSTRRVLWPSPYLDAFGEEDVDLQRGKPLFLNEERYAALTHMVASHGIDRNSDVLRHMRALFML